MRALAVLVVLLGSTSCGPLPALVPPEVRCDLPANDCERAIATARDLSPEPWSEVQSISIYVGTCVFGMSCPFQAHADHWISVELHLRDAAHDAFITIDRRGGDWSATCTLWIPTDFGANTDPCPTR